MEYSDEYYKNKYLKYKTKYDSELIKQNGGSDDLMKPSGITIPFSFFKYLIIGAGVFFATWSLKGYNDRRTAEKNTKIKILKDDIIKYGYNIGKILNMTPQAIDLLLVVNINKAMENIKTLRNTITIDNFYLIIENRRVLGRVALQTRVQQNQQQNQPPVTIHVPRQTSINGAYYSEDPNLIRYATDIHLFEYFMLGLKYTSDKILEKIQKYSNTNTMLSNSYFNNQNNQYTILQEDINFLFINPVPYQEKNFTMIPYTLDSI